MTAFGCMRSHAAEVLLTPNFLSRFAPSRALSPLPPPPPLTALDLSLPLHRSRASVLSCSSRGPATRIVPCCPACRAARHTRRRLVPRGQPQHQQHHYQCRRAAPHCALARGAPARPHLRRRGAALRRPPAHRIRRRRAARVLRRGHAWARSACAMKRVRLIDRSTAAPAVLSGDVPFP